MAKARELYTLYVSQPPHEQRRLVDVALLRDVAARVGFRAGDG